MMFLVLAITVCMAYILSKRLYSNIFNPVFIFIGVNVFSIILSLIQDFNFEYSSGFSAIVFIMFFSFLLGIVLGKKNNVEHHNLNNEKYSVQNIYSIIITFGVIYDIALVGYLDQLFSTYSIIDFFVNLNKVNAYVQSDEYQTYWFSYVTPLGLPLFLLCIYYLQYYKKNSIVILQSILSVLYCISPRRDSLFNLIVVTLFYFFAKFQDNRNIKTISKKILKYAIISVIGIIIIMSYTQTLLNKNNDNQVNLEFGELPTALNSPYLYISLNYPYLQTQELDYNDFPNTPFLASGRLLYILENRILSTDIDVHSDFELGFESFDNKYSTNTAPLLYYAFLDLGFFFFVIFIILGFLSQRAYYALNSSNIIGRIYGALWFTLLALSFRGYLIIFLSFVLSLFYTFLINKFLKPKTNL